MPRSSTASSRPATASSSARSCDTSSTVPGNASSAASSDSRDSRSRWFVGSSSTRKFAPDATTIARASRRRSPPDSETTRFSCSSHPEKRKRQSSACASGRFQHRAALVELRLVLGEVRRLHAVAEPHLAAHRVPAAEHRLEQRRLPGAVRPDERDVLAALDRERGVREQELVPGLDAQAFGDDDVATGPRRLEELEAERAPAMVRREHAVRLDALDLLELRLRLPRLRRLVPEPLDEALEPRELLRLPLGGLRLMHIARRLLAAPHVPGAGEVHRLPALELEHGGRDRFEEPAVVRDEDHRRIERAQHLLEP